MTSHLDQRLADQKKAQNKKSLIAVGIIAAILLVAGTTFWLSTTKETKRTGGLVVPDKVNILVLGVDERNGDIGRSDTMFVVTVDTNTKAVSLLSVPRDTRVKIPGHGFDKINHAYSEGGHRLSQQAAEDLLGVPLDNFVLVNFAGFYKIVDAIGGVDIDVEKRMHYEDPYDNLVIDLQPGMQHLDGKTAIKYVRYRDEEGDIGRIERQQKFIKAMLQQVASPSVITRVPAIIREVNAAITTDMSMTEMLNLAKLLNDASKQGLKTDMVPGKPAYIDEVSYWLPDVVALRQHVAQVQGAAFDAKNRSEAQSLAAQYERSIPREMKVVETPKTTVPLVKPPTTPEKPKAGDKTVTPAKPDNLRAVIVNASGDANAGDKVAATLRGRGFEIAGVNTSKNVANQTVVISHSTSSAVVNKVSSLPFNYALQINKDDNSSVAVTVVIGKDYIRK